jgi:hypothetical protein
MSQLTLQHTAACVHRRERYMADLAMWEAKWPGYCRRCGGKGMIEYSFDPSPAGVSLAPGTMTDADPCPVCLEHGWCPRCGKALTTDYENSSTWCEACEWNGQNDFECAPVEPKCECWMEAV